MNAMVQQGVAFIYRKELRKRVRIETSWGPLLLHALDGSGASPQGVSLL